jgi:type IV secretory pathway protease TraF
MVNRAPSRGDLVLACLPDAIAKLGIARGYLLRGRGRGDGIEPVGKRLAARGESR